MIDEPDIPIPKRQPLQARAAPSNDPPAPTHPSPVHNPVGNGVALGGVLGHSTVLPRDIPGRKERNGPAPQSRRRGAHIETNLPPLTSIQASPEGPEEVENINHKHGRMANPVYKRFFRGKKMG